MIAEIDKPLTAAAHLPYQLSKTSVSAKRIEREVSPQTHQPIIAFLIGGAEPPESLITVSQLGIQTSNMERRKVVSLSLGQPVSTPLVRAPFQPAVRNPRSRAEAKSDSYRSPKVGRKLWDRRSALPDFNGCCDNQQPLRMFRLTTREFT